MWSDSALDPYNPVTSQQVITFLSTTLHPPVYRFSAESTLCRLHCKNRNVVKSMWLAGTDTKWPRLPYETSGRFSDFFIFWSTHHLAEEKEICTTSFLSWLPAGVIFLSFCHRTFQYGTRKILYLYKCYIIKCVFCYIITGFTSRWWSFLIP